MPLMILLFVLMVVGFAESVLLSVGLICEARGYAKMSALMSAVNVLIWFTLVKIAVEMSWYVIPSYAIGFGLGSFFAVRWMERFRGGE